MAEFPALPLWTDAFLADTVHLDNRECGAYLLLLMASWRLNSGLPDDDALLARYAKCSRREWLRVKPAVLSFWRQTSDGVWFQKRLEVERDYVRNKTRKARRSAEAKWLKEKKTDHAVASSEQMRNGCETDAISMHPTPTPTPTPTSLSSDELRESISSPAAELDPLAIPEFLKRVGGTDDKPESPRAQRLPEDWRPSQALLDFASREGIDPQRTAENFRDYWRAASGANARKLDWDAAFRVWCRRQNGQRGSTPQAIRSARGGSEMAAFARAAARLRGENDVGS